MDTKMIKEALSAHVYHIPADKKVPLHQHPEQDEIFYCLKGEGFGVLENEEIELSPGKAFIVPAGVMHSVRSDSEIYVAAFKAPMVRE